MTTPQTAQAWRIAGASVAVLMLLIFGLYQHTVSYLAGHWNQLSEGEYAHGYLVLAISGYLIVRDRKALLARVPCPEQRALPAVVIAVALWMVAALADVEMMQTVGLWLLVLATLWTLLGNRVTVKLLFPVLFIGFAIPVWSPLSPLMQDVTADAVFGLIRGIGVPAFREENVIVMTSGRLSVEESCSGLRYLLAALTLGTLYAYLNYSTLGSRLIVVLVSAGAAIVANMLRVFIVVYLGYATDMQHPLVYDHLMLGWYLFGGLVAALLFLDARLHRHFHPAADAGASSRAATESAGCDKGPVQYLSIVAVTAVLVSAGPATVYRLHNPTPVERDSVKLGLPAGVAGWTGPVESIDDWMPVYSGAITLKQAYIKDGERVSLYVGYYPVQDREQELINYRNLISDNAVWLTRYARPRLQQAQERQVLEQLLENGEGNQLLVWYWYHVAGRFTTNKYEAKLLQLAGLLAGRRDAYVVAIATDSGDDAEHTRRVLNDFTTAMGARLGQIQAVHTQIMQ